MDGDIILDMVNHFNEKTVTLPCYNAWPRKLPIYCQNALCMAQSRHILQFDLHNISNKKSKYISFLYKKIYIS